MSREEIIKAIQECAAELKRRPSLADLRRVKGVPKSAIERVFGQWSRALRAAGVESDWRLTPGQLLLDWAGVARTLGAMPSLSAYLEYGSYAITPFRDRFGQWSAVPGEFLKFVQQQAIESEWQDVLAMITNHTWWNASRMPHPGPQKTALHPGRKRRKHRQDNPHYGPPLLCPGVANEPVNESGVVYIFGVLAERLGFRMLRMQTDFPDCEALREIRRGHWQRVRIEFEFASRNFKSHKHRKEDCDMIVCWIHDWHDCPKELEVLELRKIARGL
jgi:hypothetical protein